MVVGGKGKVVGERKISTALKKAFSHTLLTKLPHGVLIESNIPEYNTFSKRPRITGPQTSDLRPPTLERKSYILDSVGISTTCILLTVILGKWDFFK